MRERKRERERESERVRERMKERERLLSGIQLEAVGSELVMKRTEE